MKEEALKLADCLCFIPIPKKYKQTQLEASAMIRRLVEELDEKNYRILELTKRYKALTWDDNQTKCHDCGEVNPAEIHTCSPQTKPLSDEEIDKLADEHLSDYFNMQETIGFARAIEAKVRGEK